MYKKLLLSFVICITSLIVILASVLFYNYKNSSISLLKEANVNVLSKISYSAVYMDNMAKKFSQSLSLNNYIIAFANTNELDIIVTGNAIRTLDSLTIPNTYIYSAYIFNSKIDTVISSPPSTFFDAPAFEDQQALRLIRAVQAKKAPVLSPIPRKINNHNVYTYILPDTNDESGKLTNAIVVNVDADYLRLTISSLDEKSNRDSSDILVLDEKGTIVSHPQASMFMQQVSMRSYAREVAGSTSPSGTFRDEINGEKYLVSYVSSSLLKWKFVSLTPYSSVFSSVQRNGWITFILCMLVLVLGLVIAIIASKKLYRPFAVLQDRTTMLESQKRDSAAVLKNEFIRSMISSSAQLPLAKVNAKERELNFDISFTHKLFMFVLRIDEYQAFVSKHSEQDRALLKYSVENITKEITSAQYKCEVVSNGSDHVMVLVDLHQTELDQEEIYNQFGKIVMDIQASIKQYVQLSVTGTLGYMIESYEQMKLIYDETLQLSMYRLIYGHQSLITPEILKQVEEGPYYFPVSKEKQLLDALRLGNGESAKEIYSDIMQSLVLTSYDNIVRSILYLSFSVYNSLQHLQEDTSAKINRITLEFLNHFSAFETLEQIEQSFGELMDEIMQLKDGNKDKKKNEIVQSAIEFIHERYPDMNLSLSSCAEQLSISSLYLGKLFKSTTGKSVAEYITTVRMEKIRTYLDSSNLPINEILEKCGIEKSNYFYTTFKKYFGVSLTEYRLNVVKKPPTTL